MTSNNNSEQETITAGDVSHVPASGSAPAKVEKFPELRAVQSQLEKERAAIVERSAPLRVAREKLRADIEPLEAALRELNAKIKSVELPRLFEIDNQIGALAKAMGGRAMSQPAKEG